MLVKPNIGWAKSAAQAANTSAAGVDQVAVEAFAATLLGLTPGDVGYVRRADVEGVGSLKLDGPPVVRRNL